VRSPKTMAEPVGLWLPRFLSGVGACFNFVKASERLSRTGTAHRKCTPGMCGVMWEAYVSCWSGFPL
jgi:hypothetical protein